MLKDNKNLRLAAPAHLEPPERDLWGSLVKTFRFDDSAALTLLEQAMEARARARQAREAVKAEGSHYSDHRGIVRAHPMISVERAAHASFLGAMRLLRPDIAGERK
jgi:hypothetical protein